MVLHGLLRWLSGKELVCNAGDTGEVSSIPGSVRYPGGGNGNLLQYSCLENSMDRGAWGTTVHRISENRTRLKKLTMYTWFCISPEVILEAILSWWNLQKKKKRKDTWNSSSLFLHFGQSNQPLIYFSSMTQMNLFMYTNTQHLNGRLLRA